MDGEDRSNHLAIHRFAGKTGAVTKFFQFARIPRVPNNEYTKTLLHFLESVAMIFLDSVTSDNSTTIRHCKEIIRHFNKSERAIKYVTNRKIDMFDMLNPFRV